MLRVRGRVAAGHIVVDERVDLPEGTLLEILVAEGDESWPEELDDVLVARLSEADRGETYSVADVLAQLRGR